jgi:tetratricopeptide (TPR) repeat protein
LSDALALYDSTLKLRTAQLGPNSPGAIQSSVDLAQAYADAGRTLEAIALYESTLERIEAHGGADHPETITTHENLAAAYESLGRRAQAEGQYRKVLARCRKLMPADSPLLAGHLAEFGRYLLDQTRCLEAEPLLRLALAIREKANPDDWIRYDAMSLLGGTLMAQGRYAQADPLVVAGYEGMKVREDRILNRDRFRLRAAAERVIRLYEAWGQTDKAAAWKTRLGMPDLPADVFVRL